MPTLLATRKMDPALIARIEASVAGRRKRTVNARSTARLTSLVRLGAVLGVAALVSAIAVARHRDRAEFQRAQTALLEDWRLKVTMPTANDVNVVRRLEMLLAGEAREYAGDFSAEELRGTGVFASVLARPSVYVRGPIAAFSSSTGVAKAAFESGTDALLLCLFDPPATRTEKVLLTKARIALGGGPPVQALTPTVRRLQDVIVGLPFLLPRWGERVQNAKDRQEILRLERELKKAPIETTKRGLLAELLIAVYDEPNDGGGVTELDGEHSHSMRVVMIEIASAKTLLRLRKQVDPSWITPNRRSQYARELDGCRLALDVREAVQLPATARSTQEE